MLSGLTGGPSATAIGTQLGKENTQQIVASQTSVGHDQITKQVETGSVEKLNISNSNSPPWMIFVLVLGWILPSPSEIARQVYKLFKRNL